MQKLDVKEIIQKMKKTKLEIMKELEESITNGKRNENTDMQEKINNCITNEDAVKVVSLKRLLKIKKRYYMFSLSSRSNISKI